MRVEDLRALLSRAAEANAHHADSEHPSPLLLAEFERWAARQVPRAAERGSGGSPRSSQGAPHPRKHIFPGLSAAGHGRRRDFRHPRLRPRRLLRAPGRERAAALRGPRRAPSGEEAPDQQHQHHGHLPLETITKSPSWREPVFRRTRSSSRLTAPPRPSLPSASLRLPLFSL